MTGASAEPSLRLTAGAVSVYRAPLDLAPETLAWLAAPLSDAERERARRFASAPDRDRWTAARGWMRRVLGACVRRDAAALGFRVSHAGKPALDPPSQWLRFSLAHCADLAVLALAIDREVGADVERVDARAGAAPVPRRFLTAAERSALAALPVTGRARASLQMWTGKEAVVKAIGSGLDDTLADLDTSAIVRGDAVAATRGCSLRAVDAGAPYLAAVAVRGRDLHLPRHAEPLILRPG